MFWPIISLFLSAIFCFWLIRFTAKKKIALQAPRPRDLHTKPISRIGGVAIILAFLATMILIAALAQPKLSDFGFPYAILGLSIDKRLLGIFLATIFLSGVLFFDDIKGLLAGTKLITQIITAFILIAAGVGLTYLNNPFGLTIYLDQLKIPLQIGADVYHLVFWADLFFLLWVVLLTNATNFIDGLDGLAASLSLIAALILFFLSLKVGQGATALMAAVFAGAIVGFLPFNLPPAKIFLGDAGAMFLGLMLAILSVISGGKLATLLLVFGLVILDALYVIIKRIIRGRNPFTTADQTHLHHRFLAAGFTARQTLLIITAISLLFGLAGLLTGGQLKVILVGALAAVCLGLFVFLDLRKSPKHPY